MVVGGPVSSTIAFADGNGNYEVKKLTPGVTYTVTASLAGFVNDTKTVHVDPNATSAASFALAVGTSQGQMPAPVNLIARSNGAPECQYRHGPFGTHRQSRPVQTIHC